MIAIQLDASLSNFLTMLETDLAAKIQPRNRRQRVSPGAWAWIVSACTFCLSSAGAPH